MPEGEKSWMSATPARKRLGIRLSPQAHALIAFAAAGDGIGKQTYIERLVERHADRIREEYRDEIASAVEAERERRAHA